MNLSDIQTKLDTVSDNLDRLGQLPTETYEEFVSDFRTVDSALHRLQTGIQVLVDIAAYVVSNLGLRTPSSSLDVVNALHEAGHLSEPEAAKFTKMVQFRNRVVHLYNRIDHQIIYDIITKELDDIRGFYAILLDRIEADAE